MQNDTIKTNKEFLLNESKVFCMFPWTHMNVSPKGDVYPCCSNSFTKPFGNVKNSSLKEQFNSGHMKQLRLNMLNETPSEICKTCYQHEDIGGHTFRDYSKKFFSQHFDETVPTTQEDGTVPDFKMRYFDIRFSNICNFKCRTCGSGFSTQWEQEDLKSKVTYARVFPKNDNPDFLQDIVEQVPNLKTAYFAGGEPLITEEHYILLEEMIRTKKSDHIQLRYNTNMSNLKFKNKDLLALWKHFKNKIGIYASIDHYGERAEYIRHGTDWGVVEENLLLAKKTPYINLQMNTVLSVFNFLTIGDFYQYLVDKQLYTKDDFVYTLYNMSTPEHYTCHILPEEYKVTGKASLEHAIQLLQTNKFKLSHVNQLKDALVWASLYETWDKHKYAFRSEINRVDKLRGENFRKTFPELADLLDPDNKKLLPI
jgi:radical SAM protein with 4Fe4S-binding SPASM domain